MIVSAPPRVSELLALRRVYRCAAAYMVTARAPLGPEEERNHRELLEALNAVRAVLDLAGPSSWQE